MSDWLPNCIRQDFGTSGGSWARQPAIICIHSTEGMSWPGYNGGQSAPHFTINVQSGERRQHIKMTLAARALQNLSGGVETNRSGVIQIEVIGSCDPSHKGQSGWLYLPEMTDSQMAHLSKLLRDIAEDQNIAWQYSVTFKAYPSSYGTSNGVRLSGSTWNSYKGILGHQHVPENDHGDPGNINIAAIMEEDMPLADDDIRRIWNFATTSPQDSSPMSILNVDRYGYGEAARAHTDTGNIIDQVAELEVKVDKILTTLENLQGKFTSGSHYHE